MARRQARRGSGGGNGVLSFMLGLVCGLGLASFAWWNGWLPGGQADQAVVPDGRDEPPIADSPAPSRSRQFDFFTVLPEMETVVPQREIEERAREPEPAAGSPGNYVIQAGSFRALNDAESLRAQITLLGLNAQIQTVTVNEGTWHRVRLGPYDSAREADNARRRLADNGLEAMVMSGQGSGGN
ncbi:MAG: SPOR domain-containing protein [Wenzhouxiangella sp.]